MYREKKATLISVVVRIGSVMACQSAITVQSEVDWLASKLNSGKDSAKTWMRMSPRANTGIEYRMNAALVNTLSPREFRLAAWKMPSGKAIRIANSSDMPDR